MQSQSDTHRHNGRKEILYYNLNFSFHLGLNVCDLTDVARMNLAGTGPTESRGSRRPHSFLLLKLKRKL